MRRFLTAVPLAAAALLVLAGCDLNGVNAPKLETVTGVVTKTTYVVHTIAGYKEWSAGVELQDGSVLSVKTYSDESELNDKVAEGSCVQFKREVGGKDTTVTIDGADDLGVVAKDKCPWAK